MAPVTHAGFASWIALHIARDWEQEREGPDEPFDAAGRCVSFEEWPFWPNQPWAWDQ